MILFPFNFFFFSLITESLQSGIVQDSMKIAMIRSILKKQNLDVLSLNNYRPINNLTIISKTLERVVASQLTSYISQYIGIYDIIYDILNKLQSAYASHMSTETALTYILIDLHLSSSHKDGSILTLLDISSAFDTLDHNIMISRLTSIGITGTPLKWFTSYLTNRDHYIKIDKPLPLNFSPTVSHRDLSLATYFLTYTFYHYLKCADPIFLPIYQIPCIR